MGRAKVLLGGRIVLGPEVKYLIGSVLLITLPSAYFLLTSALPFSLLVHWAPMIPLYPLPFLVLYLLLKASLTDPGIIPRRTLPGVADTPFDPTAGIAIHNVVVHGNRMNIRECDTCHIYRPLRTYHCRICDVCVRKHDHHCPWLGTCVGAHNYKSFIFLIVSVSVYCAVLALYLVGIWLTAIVSGIYWLAKEEYVRAAYTFFVLAVPPLPVAPVVVVVGSGILMLTAQHVKLIARGETTHEYLTVASSSKKPFQGSWFRNIHEFLRFSPQSLLRQSDIDYDALLDHSGSYVIRHGTVRMAYEPAEPSVFEYSRALHSTVDPEDPFEFVEECIAVDPAREEPEPAAEKVAVIEPAMTAL
ncbi:DHHC palmitoyltransferase [Carpediemonas membranifera]|uniref:Palmitoyltransferase n=1 Tax=Carpediemonas membranifera TaxID=201153 RepID=A0A8J6B038_9EUKA|nr:DHHC palmitoyltransferase [Carpediemonas membranifera]|eukprot:KAG9392628.1 DHHC palmitoyltransferase [Carpediemonas membranifera]